VVSKEDIPARRTENCIGFSAGLSG
jgi:hypothetical protein